MRTYCHNSQALMPMNSACSTRRTNDWVGAASCNMPNDQRTGFKIGFTASYFFWSCFNPLIMIYLFAMCLFLCLTGAFNQPEESDDEPPLRRRRRSRDDDDNRDDDEPPRRRRGWRDEEDDD